MDYAQPTLEISRRSDIILSHSPSPPMTLLNTFSNLSYNGRRGTSRYPYINNTKSFALLHLASAGDEK